MTISKPLISIIIPTLQEEKLLSNLLDQFPEELRKENSIEIIVSDGGSTDLTLSIAREKADAVVEYKDSIPQTIAAGRNAGAKIARGDIFIFLNSDVRVSSPEQFILNVKSELSKTDVVGVTFPVRVYPEEERFKDKVFHSIYNFYFWVLNQIGVGMGRGECQVVPREYFFQVGGYDENIVAGEDFEFFSRLRRLGKISFLRSLTIYESPRRYRKFGYLWISLLWLVNGISVLLFKRSSVRRWIVVR